MSPRRLLLAGAVFTALGVAICGIAPIVGTAGAEHARSQQLLGGFVVVAGWALLAWAIHRFGRDAASG